MIIDDIKVFFVISFVIKICNSSIVPDYYYGLYDFDVNNNLTENYFLKNLPDFLKTYIDENKLQEALKDYCPNLMTCSENLGAEKVNVTDRGCCLSCECGQDCFAKGNCCADKENFRMDQPNAGEQTADGRECIETFFLDQDDYYLPNDRLYLMSKTCLEKSHIESINETISNNAVYVDEQRRFNMSSFVNIEGTLTLLDDLISRCTSPDDTDIVDVTPVTSTASGMSYRNIFCAYCNNDGSKLIEWNVSVDCLTDKDLPAILFSANTTAQTAYLAFIEERLCSIYWDPPQGASVEKCFPSRYMIVDCPSYVPQVITDLCLDKSFFIPYLGTNVVYRNVFCFICNFYDMFDLSLYPSNDGRCIAEITEMEHDNMRFSFLLNLKAFSAADVIETQPLHRCDSRLTYNPELDMCLYIKCPFYEVQVDDHCLAVVKKFTGITLQFQMDFVFHDKDTALPTHSFLKRTAEKITIETINGKDTDICESNVDGKIITSSAVVFSLYVAAKLSVAASINDVYDSFERTIALYNDRETESAESFRVKVRESSLSHYYTNYSRFMIFENHEGCGQLAALSKRQFCQLVAFQNYELLASNFISINGTTFDETEFVILGKENFTETFVGVCKDTYVNKVLYMKAGGYSNCVIQTFLKPLLLLFLFITLSVKF